MADSGPARHLGKPGKCALCTKERGLQGEVAGKQQKTPQANKNVDDSYVPGVLSTWRTEYLEERDDKVVLKAIFLVLSQ
jgi:hypothetical protein